MNKYRKSILAALAVWVLVAGAIQVAVTAEDLDAGGALTDVVVTSDATGNPVVTLEISQLRDYDTFVLEDPPRIVVDLYGVVSRLQDNQYIIGEAGVTRVRAGQDSRLAVLAESRTAV